MAFTLLGFGVGGDAVIDGHALPLDDAEIIPALFPNLPLFQFHASP